MPYCSNCGEEVEDSEKFCSNCGNNLESESDSEPEPEPQESKESDEELKSTNLDEKAQETVEKLREKGVIGKNEKVVAYSRQSRFKSPVHPASLIVTENQLIYYEPEFIGSSTETRKVSEITDFSIDSGLRYATITIRTNAMANLEFEDFPKNEMKEIRNAVRLS